MPGPQELLVIAVVALLVFGPDRLPEMMRNAARLLARFREQSQRSIEELKRAAELDELDREIRGLSRDVRDTTSSMRRELDGTGASVRRLASGEPAGADGAGRAAGDRSPAASAPPIDTEAT